MCIIPNNRQWLRDTEIDLKVDTISMELCCYIVIIILGNRHRHSGRLTKTNLSVRFSFDTSEKLRTLCICVSDTIHRGSFSHTHLMR